MTFRRFEDIDAWKTARQIAKAIYRMSASGSFRRDYGLRDQVRRAVISMMANIAEGHSRRSDREFAHFLFTAKGSAAEVESHLYIALDQGYLTEEQFQEAFAESERYAPGLRPHQVPDRWRWLPTRQRLPSARPKETRLTSLGSVDSPADRVDRVDR